MPFKKIGLAVFVMIIAFVGQGCNMPGPTIGQARDEFAKGEADDVVAAGKVVGKFVSVSPDNEDEEQSETVSYKIVDSQGVEFYVISTRPLEEGTSYVFTFDKNRGLVCSNSNPCIFASVKQSDFNYWLLILPVTFLYVIGLFVIRHYYYQTRSLALQKVISVVFPWPPLPPDRMPSGWCDEPRPGTIFLYIERVNVRKTGRQYTMDVVPEHYQVVLRHDEKLVALVSDKNAALVRPDQAQVHKKENIPIITSDIDKDKSDRVWIPVDVDLIPLTKVPSWFGTNLVLQCWFDPNNRRTVYVRGGIYKAAYAELDRPRFGDQMHIGTGDGGYNPMPETWTKLRADEYIVITQARHDMDQFVSFKCPQKTQDISVDSVSEASWDALATQDGFYRVKIKCG